MSGIPDIPKLAFFLHCSQKNQFPGVNLLSVLSVHCILDRFWISIHIYSEQQFLTDSMDSEPKVSVLERSSIGLIVWHSELSSIGHDREMMNLFFWLTTAERCWRWISMEIFSSASLWQRVAPAARFNNWQKRNCRVEALRMRWNQNMHSEKKGYQNRAPGVLFF